VGAEITDRFDDNLNSQAINPLDRKFYHLRGEHSQTSNSDAQFQLPSTMADIDILAARWPQVEVGRIVLFQSGPYAGKRAVIVEIVDHRRVRWHWQSVRNMDYGH